MNFHKILLIIQREYLSRVQKKSFFWITVSGPILLIALAIAPILLSSFINQKEFYQIQVIDLEPQRTWKLKSNDKINFMYINLDLNLAKEMLSKSNFDGILCLGTDSLKDKEKFIFYAKETASPELKSMISAQLNTILRDEKVAKLGLSPSMYQDLNKDTEIIFLNKDYLNTSNNKEAATLAGLMGAILVYFFIFLYGTQVMRGVVEEKTNRIVELIITSVKPLEWMLGKIIGIAAVALTQFIIWISFTVLVNGYIVSRFKTERFSDANFAKTLEKIQPNDVQNALEMHQMVAALDSLNFPYLFLVFGFYFIFGYLLYAAMFAAIGSAVDTETDTGPLMFPITLPLIIAFVFAQTIVQDTSSSLAFWMSIIPFTSPIIMMVRLPFGVNTWELVLSMMVLFITFILMTWIASRIYRTGILMYGKKPTFKNILTWLKY
jgi:ABC-2 type transport system permease protein